MRYQNRARFRVELKMKKIQVSPEGPLVKAIRVSMDTNS